MPFKSVAQQGYLHAHPEILGKKGLHEWDEATKGKYKSLPEHKGSNMAEKKSKKKHGFHHTTIEHHGDNSHTVRHEHEDPSKSKSYAASDLDSVHAGMQENLNPPDAAPAAAAGPAMAPGAPSGAPGPAGM